MAVTMALGALIGILLRLQGIPIGGCLISGFIGFLVLEIAFLHEMTCRYFREINDLRKKLNEVKRNGEYD